MFFMYTAFLFSPQIKNQFQCFKLQIDQVVLKRHVILTYPLSIQELCSSVGFFMFFKIIELGGAINLAATNVVFRIAHASFMPGVGIGQASSTLIGNYLGEKKIDKAKEIIFSSSRRIPARTRCRVARPKGSGGNRPGPPDRRWCPVHRPAWHRWSGAWN